MPLGHIGPGVAISAQGLYTIICIYYMPSTFYIVKLQLALGNIFHWNESILAQSQDGAENPYWGINMDFWHCLIVMTYRNCAFFILLVSTKLSRFKNRYETMYSNVFCAEFGP